MHAGVRPGEEVGTLSFACACLPVQVWYLCDTPPGGQSTWNGASITLGRVQAFISAKLFGHAPARNYAEGTTCYQTWRVVV